MRKIAEGVYLFRIEQVHVRTFGSSSRHILRIKSRIVDPQESDDERHKYFGQYVWHAYSMSSPYGLDLVRDLCMATELPMLGLDRFCPDDLVGLEFSGRANYTDVPGREEIKYLRVWPVMEAPDGEFRAPKVAKGMWQAKQAAGRAVRGTALIPAGTQVGRFRSDQPNYGYAEAMEKMKQLADAPAVSCDAETAGVQAELKVAAEHSIYCCCASPVAKHVVFDTFEYDKCETCGKEIKHG